MQSSESLRVLKLIFPSAPVVQGWTTACDWLEAPLLGHSPCHRFIESCPQGVLRTIRVVIQPESSGCRAVGIIETFPSCQCCLNCLFVGYIQLMLVSVLMATIETFTGDENTQEMSKKIVCYIG